MHMKDQLPKHQSVCQFRKVNCAVLNCKNDGLCFLKYLDHINDFHNLPVVKHQKKLDFSFSMSEDFSPLCFVWKAKRFTAFNKNFFEVGLIKNSLVYRWIYLLGFEEEAKKYHYKATLINDKTGEKISFEKQVRSMTETSESIVESENAFVVPVTTCKKFKKGRIDEVRYEIELKEQSEKKICEEKPIDSNEKCVICLDNPLAIALKECGHLVSCQECAKNLPDKCPICRAKNTGTLKIFFP